MLAHVIESVEIFGGFLSGVNYTLGSGLVCLGGTRATGKTTTLELLIGLAYPDRPVPQHLQGMSDDVTITALIRFSTGRRLKAKRVGTGTTIYYDEQNNPCELAEEERNWLQYFRTNDLETVANSSTGIRTILDELTPEALPLQQQMAEIRWQLQESHIDCTTLEKQLWQDKLDLEGLEENQQKLDQLSQVECGKLYEAQQGRMHEKMAATKVDKLLREAADGLAVRRNGLDQLVKASTEQWPNADVWEEQRELVEVVLRQIYALGQDEAALWQQAQEIWALTMQQLTTLHVEQDAACQASIAALDSPSIKVAAEEYTRRLGERKQLLQLEVESQQRQSRLDELLSERRLLLDRLTRLQDRLYAARVATAERLSGFPGVRIRLEVIRHGDDLPYRDKLVELGKGILNQTNLDRLVKIAPRTFCAKVRERETDWIWLQGATGLTKDKAKKLGERLLDAGSLYGLEEVAYEDALNLWVTDRDTEKPIRELSTGQKCTAIFPLILLMDRRVLVIDTPESHLDMGFISRVIAAQIEAVKAHRQIILATHNAIFPDAGNAETVLILESTATRGWVERIGPIDDDGIIDSIIDIMEGGREAFEHRLRRYLKRAVSL